MPDIETQDRHTGKPRAEELRAQISYHDHRYHVLGEPIISDDEYDDLIRNLRALEAAGRVRWGLLIACALGLLIVGGWVAGRSLYQPEDRVPSGASYPFQEGIFGSNVTIGSQVAALEVALEAMPLPELELDGPVFELKFPRIFVDRLLGKRTEEAVIFSAQTADGLRLLLFVLRGSGDRQIVAIDLSLSEGPGGNFVELPANLAESDSPLRDLRSAIEALLPEVDDADKEELSSSAYGIFGPFAGSEEARDRLVAGVSDNIILDHVVNSIEDAGADVSVAAAVYAVRETTASAIYLPHLGLALRSLWDDGDLNEALGHELTHAYVDRVVSEPDSFSAAVTSYFNEAHPNLVESVIPLFYEELASEGLVEEALAFIVGALANDEPMTTFTIRFREPVVDLATDIRFIFEPILVSDIAFLIALDLLPECMSAERTGSTGEELRSGYFKAAREACLP